MIIIYLHSSLVPCGPTNQFKTFISNPSNYAQKYYFILKHSKFRVHSSSSKLSPLHFLRLLLTNKSLYLHSSGLLPDLLLYILSFLFPQHKYFLTIRNIPWVDYSLLYPAPISRILSFVHLHVISCNRIIPICCSSPLLLAIKKKSTIMQSLCRQLLYWHY